MDTSSVHGRPLSPLAWVAWPVRREPYRSLSLCLLTGVVFFLTALMGLHMGLPGTSVSPVWIPSGRGARRRDALRPPCPRRCLDRCRPCTTDGGHSAVGERRAGSRRRSGGVGRRPGAVLLLRAGVPAHHSSRRRRAARQRGGYRRRAGRHRRRRLARRRRRASGGRCLDHGFTWWLGDASGLLLATPLVVYLAKLPPGRSQAEPARGGRRLPRPLRPDGLRRLLGSLLRQPRDAAAVPALRRPCGDRLPLRAAA